ncbi:TIGR02328 family protein [Phocicoccus pinnipedialis]|uniref:Pyrimidine dimer DNA glycosylase n=1 Tax=Phocicoccus pinnipedialis TaxID=110845 RepID=A0A6V7R8C8_9BACL|nr:TIGR02328 family protein [Jeotgalicoccus pinnipedialis]MBP1940148.1 uncharacterized protein (TIGR02328 family) [Jeotgalicoccus pinnipedialis]CAD2073747.1 hypothetical protein JEOPIN946_00730 [Jeotgalicoccus pinnipedialis]
MRLWHEELIPLLPRNQLLGQHRECCALRGKGWKKPHATVNYVFEYSPYLLYQYHYLVMNEMKVRGYNVSEEWWDKNYRGKQMAPYDSLEVVETDNPIYKEHNTAYLKECLDNLKEKQIIINVNES